MSKQLVRTYAFTPGTAGNGTIEILGKYALEQITLITNVTRSAILYNFADASYNGTTAAFTRANSTAFPKATDTADGTTLIYLAKDTSSYSATDNIQIFIERDEQLIRPWPLGTDGFERMRMAAPQSMLDADFEYGLQPTKWLTLDLSHGGASIYEIPGTDLALTSITSDSATTSSLITVVTTIPHNLSTSSPFTVAYLDRTVPGYARAQGSWVINSVTSLTSFNYYAKGQVGTFTNQSVLTPYTVVRKGGFYTNSLQTCTYAVSGSGASSTGTITLTFAQNHGYVPGQGILSVVTSDNGSNNNLLAQGAFYVSSVPSPTTLTFNARNVGSISGTVTGYIYPRPDSFYVHRALDGGVALGAGNPAFGTTAVRQSKKYIRYQSGKAINYNTAALFAPNYDVRSVTATNTTVGSPIYVVTDEFDHGLQAGGVIQINGVTSSGYNGTYTVAAVIDERTVQLSATNVLSTTSAVLSQKSYINHTTWQGATVRAGTFDDQNGIFYQYDGSKMAAVLRYSTWQLAGTVTATPNSTLITGANTSFTQQIAAGDRVVIRGMSYAVTSVPNDTTMYIFPPYRGTVSATPIKAAKTVEKIWPQSQWNVDTCDGSNSSFNPSGFNLQPWKVLMIGLQWTWYGAGFIEWMIRGPDGRYMVVHRVKNSNVNVEAFMRSGNQPVRYEITNEGARSQLTAPLSSAGTVMTLTDVTYFANSGTVYVDNELIGYTSKTTATNTLNGLTRTATYSYWANGSLQNFTASNVASAHTSGTGVISVGLTASPTLTHWGSAFLTDGGFDNDRGYIFNYQVPNITVSTLKSTAFAIRLSPSVSNATPGDLGTRDLINRAQLLLQQISNTVGGGSGGSQAIVIEGVINPSNYPSTATNVTWTNLQGPTTTSNPTGSGQPSFTQVAYQTGIKFDNTATYTTTLSASASTGSTTLSVNSTASVKIGDAVITTAISTTGGIGIAGNTLISAIGAGTVTLTQPILSFLPNNTNLSFYRNTWAVPGETIFSFISSPGSKDILDLSQLKELTNTPIGGSGTFPNGPDTLFINVYLTSGPSLLSNLVLTWGEAQA